MPFFESFPCSSCSSFRWHLCCCFATPFASGLSKAVNNGAMDREGHTFCRESLMEDCFKVANFQPCYKYCYAKLPYIHPWSVTEPFDIIYRNTVLDRIGFFFWRWWADEFITSTSGGGTSRDHPRQGWGDFWRRDWKWDVWILQSSKSRVIDHQWHHPKQKFCRR